MGEQRSIWYKIGNIDYRIIYLIVALLTAWPLWSPVGTPMTVGDNVKSYADHIRDMEPGTVVLSAFAGYMTMLPDIEPIYLATWKMLFEQDVKIMVRVTDVDGPVIIRQEFEKLNPEENFGKVYGVDYMIFPYVLMPTATEIAFTDNIRSVFTTDYYGTPLDDLPIMQGIESMHDVDWYFTSGADWGNQRYTIPYGVKLLCWGTGTGLLPFVPPFYDPVSGPCYGYVGGASQGGELELESGFFGNGVKYNDAKNMALVGLFFFVLLGNISYFGEKYLGGS